jgi:hypothetical protein
MRRRWLVLVTAVAVPAMWVALLPAGVRPRGWLGPGVPGLD